MPDTASNNVLIVNALVHDGGPAFATDVLVRNGRIAKVAPNLSQADLPPGTTVTDAAGRWLMPGLIDDQVHFREPGLTHKGDLSTESAAAAAGGVTSFMDMPNTNPTTTTREKLAEKYAMAAGRCHANYGFHFGVANDNLDEVLRITPEHTGGLKIFMGSSTGNMLVDNLEVLEKVFAEATLTISTHCEDTPMILANEALAREKYGEDVPFSEHPHIRSVEACYKSSHMAVELAKKHGTHLHVLHISTARELELFPPGPMAGKHITAEACVHHMFFDESRYADMGSKLKCNPAVKSGLDRAAIVGAVREGRINIIATDHAPHTKAEKANTYFKAPSGLPLVQHVLPMLLELVARGELDMATVIERACHAPAARFGIVDRGHLREGYFADLTLVDPEKPFTVTADGLYSKCGWAPVEGHTFSHSVAATWVNGVLAWDGANVLPVRAGERLSFVARRGA